MLAEPPAVSAIRAAPQPTGWFFQTPAQRRAWARQRFFEDGVRPTGLVSEAVIQSWSRCLQARQSPARMPEFRPVTVSRRHTVLTRHHALLATVDDELRALQQALAGGPAVALLADAQGVVLHTSHAPDAAQCPVLARAARVGVELSEASVGTNAPDLALRSGALSVVCGAEHFADAARAVHCAAKPVRGADGRIVAVLNLSTEGRDFAFDAAAVVRLYASAIENRLLLAEPGLSLVLRLQMQPALLDSALAGLIGLDAAGALRWCNAAARRLLGADAAVVAPEQALGLGWAALQQRADRGGAEALTLPSGLQVWLQVLRAALDRPAAHAGLAPPGAAPCAAAAAPAPAAATADPTPADAPADAEPPASLRDKHRALVEQTLQACGGNVSAAARRLGVSRGLIYRHRRPVGAAAAPGS